MAEYKHIYKDRYKILLEPYVEKLEESLNKFTDTHYVISVDIKNFTFDQSGIALGDRYYKDSKFAIFHEAVIKYRIDWTQEMVNKGLREYIERIYCSENSLKLGTGNPFNWEVTDSEKMIEEFASRIEKTTEYQKLKMELLIKYSEPRITIEIDNDSIEGDNGTTGTLHNSKHS